MTRVLSGAVLLVLLVGAVQWAPSWLFLLIAEVLVVIGCTEYCGLAGSAGLKLPVAAVSGAAALTTAAVAFGGARLDGVLMAALVLVGVLAMTEWQGAETGVVTAAAALFPAVYLGLPIGALVAVRSAHGSGALFLLMLTIVVSDTAQYYFGRAFGRQLLAPRISPKKTVEGALAGFLLGAVFFAIAGAWWLPGVMPVARMAMGFLVVALGIAGDLFESMIKRSAGAKDSSTLIPGHGGILDRVDALLFAAPIYYLVLKYS
jgi:phosphatidate cytidylyltransferase